MTMVSTKRRELFRPVRVSIFALALLLLSVSLFCNVVFLRQAKASYRELSELQLDPYGLKESPPIGDRFCGVGPKVIFFGDSRAKQWIVPNPTEFGSANCGISNQTTEQIRARFDAHVAPLEPRIVILQAGINDLKAIGVLPDRRNQIIATCKANLRAIIERSTERGATVIVTTIFPTGDVPLQRRLVWSSEIDKAIEEVNADLRTINRPGVIVMDAWKLLQDGGKLRPSYAADTLHLTAEGYAVLNAELKRMVVSLPPNTGERN